MSAKRAAALVNCVVFLCCSLAVCGQSGYEVLIQQGKAQLQAGHADQALASGEQAIKLDAKNWEGYALAGGALMNLKRYDEAITEFSDAIERATQDKQAGLSELRRQCFAAESGGPTPASTPTAPTTSPTTPEATTTQAEIVLWKSIENSTNPGDFQGYLSQYPGGAFAVLARQHLADLNSPTSKIKNLMGECQNLMMQTRSQNSTVQIRDRKEFDAFADAEKIKDPQQQTSAFRGFLAKYPNSVVRESVLESLFALDVKLKSNDAALTDDESILSTEPSDRRALFIAGYLYNLKSQAESDPAKKREFQSKAVALLQRCVPGGN